MYAVLASGGKQYKVREGDIVKVEKLPGEIGSEITFDRVLMVTDGDEVTLGDPHVADAAVKGHIVAQNKAKKILVFKYKRRKRFRRKQGHRQQYTAVQIDQIAG
ncbi:MAG: 50S ribosomal protein L21 [Desulfobacterales bacterium]